MCDRSVVLVELAERAGWSKSGASRLGGRLRRVSGRWVRRQRRCRCQLLRRTARRRSTSELGVRLSRIHGLRSATIRRTVNIIGNIIACNVFSNQLVHYNCLCLYSGLLQAGNNRSCLLIDVHKYPTCRKMRHVIFFTILSLHPILNVCWLMGLCFYF